MRLRLLTLSTLIFVNLFVLGCKDSDDRDKKSIEIKEKKVKLPSKYTLQDGNKTVIIELNDKQFKSNIDKPMILLNFFATWCPPCKAEIPHLVNIQKRYEKNIAIIGVLVENLNHNKVNEFSKRYNINYFVSYNGDNMRLANEVANILHQPRNFSIPMMVFFVNGKYFRHYIGMVPEEMLESDIKDALKLINSSKKDGNV